MSYLADHGKENYMNRKNFTLEWSPPELYILPQYIYKECVVPAPRLQLNAPYARQIMR